MPLVGFRPSTALFVLALQAALEPEPAATGSGSCWWRRSALAHPSGLRRLSLRAPAPWPLDGVLGVFELLGEPPDVAEPSTSSRLSAPSPALSGRTPRVTITMTIILVLPFTFGPTPPGARAMTGVYVGGECGRAHHRLPDRDPGTPSAIATMSTASHGRKGEPGRAIWLGVWASVRGRAIRRDLPDRRHRPPRRFRARVRPWEYFSSSSSPSAWWRG